MELKSLTEVFPQLSEKNDPAGAYYPFIWVERLSLSHEKAVFTVYARLSRLLDVRTLELVEAAIANRYFRDYQIRVKLQVIYDLPSSYDLNYLVSEFKAPLIDALANGDAPAYRVLRMSEWKVLSDNALEITVPSSVYTKSYAKIWAENLRTYFKNAFTRTVAVEIRLKEGSKAERAVRETEKALEFFREKREENARAAEETTKKVEEKASLPEESAPAEEAPALNLKATEPSSEKAVSKSSKEPAKELRKGKKNRGKVIGLPNDSAKYPNLLYGRPIREESHPISEILPGEERRVTVRGQIFAAEITTTRTGRVIYTFKITDFEDSIAVKLFPEEEDLGIMRERFAPGAFVKLQGLAAYDQYAGEVLIRNVNGIEKIAPFALHEREDRAKEKRVELHLHTQMSEFDALIDPKDAIKRAIQYGHKAIAVTDHGCVYAFPIAAKALAELKKDNFPGAEDFKVIFGMEGYLVDDTKAFIIEPKDHGIEDPVVVFDIETTGLSKADDRIIEIGAVKIENGEIVDRFSTFVNPERPIPLDIELLTNINDLMVKDADPIDVVLPKFLNFIEGCVLVAHNASFDIGFIRENARQLFPGQKLDISSVDTLGLARVLFPHLNNFKLDTVAKECRVPLLNHHRAVDDAECTALIYRAFIKRFRKNGFTTLSEVRDHYLPTMESIRKLHPFHIVILAASETGRMNLYRLVTESSLNYFHKRPLIPKSLLQKYREGLIFGSACEKGELYSAILEGAPDEELLSIASFYDYLEVQPLGNNAHLLRDKHYALTEEDLRRFNRKIVSLGELLKKPVVATTDAHFMDPEDAFYREIMQFERGFQDAAYQAPLYFRTTDEMLEEFEYLGSDKAYEIVVTNTNKIADLIGDVRPLLKEKCPPEIEHSDEMLRNACYKKAHEIYGDPLPEIVEQRLEDELEPIISNGYAVMYMIAEKLVSKSLSDGYVVGSRGSVGSSFVATMSGITEVNPLKPHYVCPNCHYSEFDSPEIREAIDVGNAGCDLPDKICPVCGAKLKKDGFNIPFETFLGFKGDKKEPDIDLNFSGEYQAKAHAYTEVIFGKGQTFRAGTYGTMKDNTAIAYVKDYLAKHGIEKRHTEILRIADKLVGVRRTTGQHPGGIVVLPIGEDIHRFTPIQHPANDMESPIITTAIEYHSISENLLKLDILGHKDPTTIRMIYELTGKDPQEFPLDSKEVNSLFSSTEVLGITPSDIHGTTLGLLGIPEFGTDFAMEMVKACKPTCISDLVRITGMAHGTDVWSNNNQILFQQGVVTLSTAICCRDDIMEYLIRMGFDSSKAFKIMEAVRKGKGLRPEWEAEMREKNVPEWYIGSCNKIKYMFPKAHAAAYVMMLFRIAYCKVFYPVEFYCSYYSIRTEGGFSYEKMCFGLERLRTHMAAFKKIEHPSKKELDEYDVMRIVEEMYVRGIEFVPIDLETAHPTAFQITADHKIMPSWNSIEGLGDTAAMNIVNAVHDGKGPFTSESNFQTRAKVSQTVVDKLVKLGILVGLPKDDQFSLFEHF